MIDANAAPKGASSDKASLIQLVEKLNEAMGFVPDPTASGEQAQRMTSERGIAPEENILSSGIISVRDEG